MEVSCDSDSGRVETQAGHSPCASCDWLRRTWPSPPNDPFIRRHEDDATGLRWHLERSGELEKILQQAQVEDFAVDATRDSIHQVAAAVMAAVRW